MKKIITLLLAVGAFGALQAQTSKEEARKVILGQGKTQSGSGSPSTSGRDVILGGGNNGTSYPDNRTSYPNNYPSGSRQARIDQVNREYDAKIWSIRNNNNLSQAEKDRIIRQLEKDRARRINEINNYDKNRRYEDDDDNDSRSKTKSNNGKHLGWEKGKGNPHKNGGSPGKGKKG